MFPTYIIKLKQNESLRFYLNCGIHVVATPNVGCCTKNGVGAISRITRVLYQRNTVHLNKGLSELILIGSTYIFFPLQCIPNLTLLYVVQLTLCPDNP